MPLWLGYFYIKIQQIMGRQIFAAEVSHEDTPLAIREKLAANEATVKQHLRQLNLVADEVFVLSTCNRFTVYIINNDISPLTDFFAQYPGLKGYVQFYYNTEESVTHLFAVASGLLSPIKGDHQILVQIRQAHKWALACNTIGITLDNLLGQALRIGKRVRTETGIDKFCSSVVDAGIELLYNRLDSLHNKKFLIIGTGKIARLALKYLYNEGIQNIHIVSKDINRAHELANLYYVEAVDIENIHEHVKNADVIIGGTHYEVSLFPESYLSGFFEHDKMWFILDFGMPRNFNSKLAEHNAIELYNLDDLKRLYKSPLDAFGGIEAAWTIVMREAKGFMEVLAQLEFSPVLVAYWNRLMYIKNREMNVLLPKLDEQLSQGDIDSIKKQAHKLIRNMSGNSWDNIRVLANNTQAKNGRAAVNDLSDFSQVKFNISLN
jgi:glutamyl-tRNA reductase